MTNLVRLDEFPQSPLFTVVLAVVHSHSFMIDEMQHIHRSSASDSWHVSSNCFSLCLLFCIIGVFLCQLGSL